MTDNWPCHRKPQSEWCDRYGPGDFMGHTCVTIERILRREKLKQAQREVQFAEDRLHAANMKLAALIEKTS